MPYGTKKPGSKKPGSRTPLKAEHVLGEGTALFATPRMYTYLVLAYEAGATQGSPAKGTVKFTPEVERLIEAFHHVLAGGVLEKNLIQTPGNQAIVDDLYERLEEAVEETNLVNKKHGSYKCQVLL